MDSDLLPCQAGGGFELHSRFQNCVVFDAINLIGSVHWITLVVRFEGFCFSGPWFGPRPGFFSQDDADLCLREGFWILMSLVDGGAWIFQS